MKTRKLVTDGNFTNVVCFGSYGLKDDYAGAVESGSITIGGIVGTNTKYFIRIKDAGLPGYLRNYEYRYIPTIVKTDDDGRVIYGTYYTLSSLGKNGSSMLVEGRKNFAENLEAIYSYLTQHLSIIKNELWFDYSYGLPLVDKIKIKTPIDTIVSSIVESTPGVISLVNFSSKIEKHQYIAKMNISTIYGSLEMSI